MKKFAFPLEKVVAWRRIQVQLAEAELERLHRQQRNAEMIRHQLGSELTRVEQEFLKAPSAHAGEFVALGAFREHAVSEKAKLEQTVKACKERVAEQAAIVTSKRRDLRLLEQLKEHRLHSWTEESNKETTQLAEESFLARWKPH